MVEIHDNILSKKLCDFLCLEILDCPLKLHSSNGNLTNYNNNFFAYHFKFDDFLVKYFAVNFLSKFNKKLKVKSVNANIQFKGQQGDWHQDDCDYTFLWMISPSLKPGDGCFEIQNQEKIDFVQDRLIIFDSKKTHRGNNSVEENPRITIALKTIVV